MTTRSEIESCLVIKPHTNVKRHIKAHFGYRIVGPMARSYCSVVRYKLGIIYVALSHIHMIQTLKM